MNISDLTNLISSVGFPIVVSIAMFYENNVLSANYQKIIQQLEDKIDNNTGVLTRLIGRLDQDDLLTGKSDNNVTTNRQA